jgi:predicted secreted hydrolase
MKSVMTRNGILLICLIFTFFAWPAQVQSGFLQVTGPCRLSFPSDHGSHPDYRTEWWYYTGNLTDGGQPSLRFPAHLFPQRAATARQSQQWPDPASAWRTDQIYLAHAAISDITGGRHLQAERMARPVLSMAGADQTDGDGYHPRPHLAGGHHPARSSAAGRSR